MASRRQPPGGKGAAVPSATFHGCSLRPRRAVQGSRGPGLGTGPRPPPAAHTQGQAPQKRWLELRLARPGLPTSVTVWGARPRGTNLGSRAGLRPALPRPHPRASSYPAALLGSPEPATPGREGLGQGDTVPPSGTKRFFSSCDRFHSPTHGGQGETQRNPPTLREKP